MLWVGDDELGEAVETQELMHSALIHAERKPYACPVSTAEIEMRGFVVARSREPARVVAELID